MTHATHDPQLPFAPPRGRRRWWIGGFIVAVLAVQVGAPASYYLADHEATAAAAGGAAPVTEYDERFAWRMFSGKRAERCGVKVSERLRGPDGSTRSRPLQLSRVIHKAWENALTRWRPDVVEAFLSRRCAEPWVTRVDIARRCRAPDGQLRPPSRAHRDCPVRLVVP